MPLPKEMLAGLWNRLYEIMDAGHSQKNCYSGKELVCKVNIPLIAPLSTLPCLMENDLLIQVFNIR